MLTLQSSHIRHVFQTVSADEKKADTKYVKYCLDIYKKIMLNISLGATQDNMSVSKLLSLKFPIPDLKIQKKIAAVLSTYDDLIEVNKKRIQLLENMAEELYKEWFIRFRFPNWENTEFEKGIPKDWSEVPLKDLGNIITGKTPSMSISEYHNGDIPFYKTPDMHDKIFVFETEDTITEYGLNSQKSQIIEPNAIMVTCIGTGGVTAIATKRGCTNQQINSITLRDEKLLYWAFLTVRRMKPQIELFGATGTTMTNLSKGKFSNLLVLKPSNKLIASYQKTVSPMFEQIKKLRLCNVNLSLQKENLLTRLISGQLLVEDLNIEFPPSMQNIDSNIQ